jgi:hypothetical protein
MVAMAAAAVFVAEEHMAEPAALMDQPEPITT